MLYRWIISLEIIVVVDFGVIIYIYNIYTHTVYIYHWKCNGISSGCVVCRSFVFAIFRMGNPPEYGIHGFIL